MTKEEINKLIVESNLLITTVTNGYQVWMPENIEKFAELVAKAEREAIAEMVSNCSLRATPQGIAAAIRTRGSDGT